MDSVEDGMEIYRKLAVLNDIKKNKKDRLKLLIYLTFHVMHIPVVRLIMFYVFCQYSVATVLTIYYLLSKFDKESVLKHGSFCGIQIFVMINLGVVVFASDGFYKMLQYYDKNILPVQIINEKTFKVVPMICNMMKVICCVNIIFATIAALGFIAAPEYFRERTYLCVWIEEMFPEYSSYLLIVVYWTSLPVALVLAGSSVGWTYTGITAIFQLWIIKELVVSIMKTTIPKKLRRDSNLYQNIVREKMIICIEGYNLAVRFHSMTCDMLYVPLMMVSIGSLILGGSLMIEVLSSQEQNLGDQYAIYVGIFFFLMAGLISGNLYLVIGQLVKEESESIRDTLEQIPWYDMNKRNKRIYSIFLYLLKQDLGVGNSLIKIDYILLVRIGKGLYSMAAVLAQFVSSEGQTEST